MLTDVFVTNFDHLFLSWEGMKTWSDTMAGI